MENPPIEVESVPKTEALAVRQSQAISPGLFGTQDPSIVIERAKSVAQSLKDVIVKQGLVKKIQGKEYPKCEAWTLLGTMLGVFPVLCWSRPIGGGWEARVEARTKDGSIVGAAEAECLKSESNWSNRDDFALRSMAQTRATAKCLRMPLGFVMSLSGFQPTPAEEMVADHPHKPEPKPPRAPAASKPAPFPTAESRTKMIAQLEAGPGEPNRDFITEFFRKLTWLAPFEKQLEDLELRYVPSTMGEMRQLSEKLSEFGNGEQISAPYNPHDEPGKATAPSKTPKEDEAWRDVIVPIPPKGMKRADYLKNPQTIGQLFDMRHGDDEESQAARQRLWGFVNHFEAKLWTGNDGKQRPPSDTDVKFRESLDQFAEWFERNHPGEKL